MPDLVLTNARIHTMDAAQPAARSLAIRGNTILALGADDALRSLLPDAEVIYLHDRCVIPGLIDAHLRAEWTALGLKNIDAEAPTLDELLRRVEERVKITPAGAWIRGHGWNQNVWGGMTPYALETINSNSEISHEKASRELGYQPRPIFVTVRDTIAWWKSIRQKRSTYPV